MFRISMRRLPIAAAALALAIQAAGNTGVVRKVHSGDLVQFGDSFIARLTGIKAPPRNESLGYKIYDFTKRELEGQTVVLVTWTTDNTAAGIVHDDAGYPFVQIFYGKKAAVSFNEVMLKKGYARVDPQYLPDGLKHYLDLEKEAREKRLGIWKQGQTPPPLDGVLRKYIEALGGREAIDRIRTSRLRGELTHEFPGQNPSRTVLPAEVISAVPAAWRLVLKTSAGVQQMGFDGTRGWLQDADRILIDHRQARSKLAYLFNPRGAARLAEYFSPESLRGTVVSEGRAEHAVRVKGTGGTPETLYFDAETGLLNRLGEKVIVKEYRRTEGVILPVHIVVLREGGTSTYRFDEIEINPALDEKRFAMPSLGEVFPEVFEGLTDPNVVPLLKDFPSVHEDMNVPCRDGRFLHDLIVRRGYKRGLEIGSFTGYSALWLGLAFKKTSGRLVTIECEPASGEEARKNVSLAGLETAVDARIADAFAEIPKIEGEFDFVFIDAWKPDYVKFLNLVRNRVAAGGAIVGHNVTNYARDMRDYLAAVRNDPGLETTFHELSAEGMSVSVVRDPGSPKPASGRRPNASGIS